MTWLGIEADAEAPVPPAAQRRYQGREHCRAAPTADRPLPSQKQVAASTVSAKPSNSRKVVYQEPYPLALALLRRRALADLERRDRLFREWVRFLGLLPAPAKP